MRATAQADADEAEASGRKQSHAPPVTKRASPHLEANKVLPVLMAVTAAKVWAATWAAMVATVETASMVAEDLKVPWDLLVEMAEMARTE